MLYCFPAKTRVMGCVEEHGRLYTSPEDSTWGNPANSLAASPGGMSKKEVPVSMKAVRPLIPANCPSTPASSMGISQMPLVPMAEM